MMSQLELTLMHIVLSVVWIVTGLLSLGIYPEEKSLELLAAVGLGGDIALFALYGSALIDLLMGILTLLQPSRQLWLAQGALIVAYSLIITLFMPYFWLHPFGPLLKNLPLLLLLWLLYRNTRAMTC